MSSGRRRQWPVGPCVRGVTIVTSTRAARARQLLAVTPPPASPSYRTPELCAARSLLTVTRCSGMDGRGHGTARPSLAYMLLTPRRWRHTKDGDDTLLYSRADRGGICASRQHVCPAARPSQITEWEMWHSLELVNRLEAGQPEREGTWTAGVHTSTTGMLLQLGTCKMGQTECSATRCCSAAAAACAAGLAEVNG